MKSLILMLLCLTTINKVFSLDCYVTDLEAVKNGDMRPKVQNCRENIKQVLAMQGQSTANIPNDHDLNCYQVNVKSDAMSIAVKGCVPKGNCGLMEKVFQNMFGLDPANPVKEINCHECHSNKCNYAGPNSADIKSGVGLIVGLLVAFAIII